MSLPTCEVTVRCYTQDGEPDPGALVVARLNRAEVYEGYIIPEEVEATADASGVAVLTLFRNELGSTESSYKIRIEGTGGAVVKVTTVVPDQAEANLEDIATLPPFPAQPEAAQQLAEARASAALAEDWANKTSGTVDGIEFAAKEYAQGTQASTGGSAKNWAQGVGQVTGAGANDRSAKSWAQADLAGATLGGSAKDWAQKTDAAVDDVSFSAKEFAQGTQAGTGGSAKNWAQQTGADVTGAAVGSRSSKSWAQDDLSGATLGGSSKDWAQKTDATVDGATFSSKEFAQGSQAATGGSSKNWAQETGADVTGAAVGSRSSKSWAQDDLTPSGDNLGGSSKDWAISTSLPDGTNKSAKSYAADAAAAAGTATTQAGTATTQAGIATTQAGIATTKAGEASDSATLAEAAEVAAEAAQLAAEIAQDTAMTTGRLYADAATGLAAVGANEFFLVPVSSTDYTELILYQDVAGVATERGRWVIAYSELAYMAGHVFAFRGGEVPAYIDEKGELRLKGHERGVHERLDDARAQSFIAAAVPLGLRCENDTSVSESVQTASELIDGTLGGTAWDSNQFEVLSPSATQGWRFPTLMQLSPGRALLFGCELIKPYVVAPGGDVKGCRIMACDVTFDFESKALTVSEPRVVVDHRAFTSGGTVAIALGHTPVVVRTGTNKGRIWMLFSSNKDDPATVSAEKPYITYSDDDGVTWAAESELPVATGGYDNFAYGTGMRGIQLRYGSNRGRLILPYYSNTSVSGTQCFAVYSDDGGANWTRGTPFGAAGVSEPTMAEDTDGTVWAIVRDNAGPPYYSQLYRSTDGGATFSLVTQDYLANSGVQVAIAQAAEPSPTTPKLMVSYPSSTADRSKMTAGITYDGWDTRSDIELDAGNAGYSSIEPIGQDYVLVAWEKKRTDAYADRIFLQAINVKHVTG